MMKEKTVLISGICSLSTGIRVSPGWAAASGDESGRMLRIFFKFWAHVSDVAEDSFLLFIFDVFGNFFGFLRRGDSYLATLSSTF